MALLGIAARSPDHGKLEPWRFIVLRQGALRKIGVTARALAEKAGADADKAAHQYETGNLAVAVIEVPKESAKVPVIEQTYSAGAVCLALLNAALAAGWGANWLLGWASHNAQFREAALGLHSQERIAGIIHIGTGPAHMPDRPHPDMARITQWRDE